MPLLGWFIWMGHLCIVAAGIHLVSAVKSALVPSASWAEPPLPMIVQAGICLPAISLVFAWSSRNWAWAHQAARSWSRGVATIVKSERKYVTGTLFSYPRGLDIKFEFEADGSKFVSEKVRFGIVTWSEQRVILACYHLDKKVCVFYDPKNPERNCLQTTRTLPEFLLAAHLAAFIAGIPIGLIV